MRESASGIVTGVYKLIYDDGTFEKVPIANGRNCGNWVPYKGRVTTQADTKYLNDVRYVWEGAKNKKEETPCLYQYEWVNPKPDLIIKEVKFSSLKKETDVMLFAVTLRKLRE